MFIFLLKSKRKWIKKVPFGTIYDKEN